LKKITSIDKDLLFAINGAHYYFTDCIMWLYSGRIIWIPIALAFVGFILYKKNWREWAPLLIAFVILFFLCDKISAEIIKPLFLRLRPSHNPDIMNHIRILYQYRGGTYGFVSSHCANAAGLAMFSSFLFKNKIYTSVIILWALAMGYSRIYLGVHYVSDVLGGMLLGTIIGYITYLLYINIVNNLSTKVDYIKLATYTNKSTKYLAIGIMSYIIFFSLLSTVIIDYCY
jgi:undecaprenyl-diphosphatase